MFGYIRSSISRKFMTAVMATTFISVLVSGLANLAYDVHEYRVRAVEEINSQADLLARVSVAALEFDDQSSVQQTLAQLKSRADFRSAAIYRADDTLFASYTAVGAPARPATPGIDGAVLSGNDVRVFKRITRGSEALGTIYLHESYPLDERIARNSRTLAAVVALSMLIAAVVSVWLQAAVTKPVMAVTDAVRDLVERRDFSRRVEKTTTDETGVLVNAFNAMSQQIGAHSAQIEQSNAALHHEVAQRLNAEHALQELNASLEERIAARSRELETAHEQLRHAQKMEAIGQLTGGVAHDFNNVLHVISGNLQLLAMSLPENAAAQKRIETAKFATDRGAKLSSQLLSFARRQPLKPSPTDLGRIVRDMDDMLRRALGEGVEIDVVVAAQLWNTLIDPHQLENVILNLAINGRDAMQGQGTLTLELGNVVLDEGDVAREPELAAGQYVVLAISDTGAGMPPEVVERAFEPFFTTKPEGEGTGLGLSMAFGFVKQSNGHIRILSEVGVGTTIKMYFARSHDAEEAVFNMTAGQVVGGNETILVVEDDLAVQATAVDTLTELGYQVLRANDGNAAWQLLQNGVCVDMLFTDVVMPGELRSPDLARKAKELLPDIAVLFTSGYTQNAIVHGGRLDPGVELISKPYRREDLARKIRHVLANAAHVAGLRRATQTVTLSSTTAVTVAPPPAAGRRVLIVEDDVDNREILEMLLGLLGHDVVAAASAEDGLALFAPDAFDVLVTDLHLPGMSGSELAARLRALAPGLQVVIASGAAEPGGQYSSLGYRTLLKPYKVEDLELALG